MSQHVDLLSEAYELFNAQFASLKGGDLDPLVAFFDPEVVIELVDVPDPATYRGHDGVRSWFNDVFAPWAAVHVEAEEITEAGEWTVALLRSSLRGHASGVELEISTAAFHQFRDGRIVLDHVYLDREEGLEAFGLKR
jgi:ketosteroid isomerase-like protein